VTEVHHLHIWPLSTTETALTAHLVMSDPNNDPEFIPRVAEHLRLVNHIGHTTFQLELSADDKGCDGCNEPAAAPGS
jgi:cobalt-zinc-cadmium efflux system protein